MSFRARGYDIGEGALAGVVLFGYSGCRLVFSVGVVCGLLEFLVWALRVGMLDGSVCLCGFVGDFGGLGVGFGGFALFFSGLWDFLCLVAWGVGVLEFAGET